MEQILEIIGTIIGLVYLWLEYRASIYLWIASIIMPTVYLMVYYQAGLYADFGINLYYLIAAIYGWLMWQCGGKLRHLLHLSPSSANQTTPDMPITHLPLRYLPAMTVIFTGCLIGIAIILIKCTDSTVPWIDSFTTALSIISMWMLARKYVEQWLTWIVVDIVSTGLYVYKGLELTAGLYLLYALIATLGYLKWKRIMKGHR